MTVSYPDSIWDGDSPNRNSDNAPQAAPDYRDWERMFQELFNTQTRIDANNAGRDSLTLHAPGTLATKTGLSVVEKGDGAVHKTIITFTEMEMVSTDGTTPATDGAWGTQLLYTFPQGHILVHGTHVVFPLAGLEAVTGGGTGFSDTADFELGVGTAAAAQAASFDLNGGDEEDVVAALDVDLTSKTSDAIESAANGTAEVIDGSTSAKTYNLNFRTRDDADHGTTADVLKVSGTFTILWSALGDD